MKIVPTGLVNVKSPDGETIVPHDVLQKMLDLGIVHHVPMAGGGHDVYHGRSVAEVDAALMQYGACDFCGTGDPVKTFIPMPDFQLPTGGKVTDSWSRGAWAACQTCADLVRSEKRQELLQRALDSIPSGKFNAALLKSAHDAFWNAKYTLASAAGVGAALLDFVNDKVNLSKKVTDRDKRIDVIKRFTGMTMDEVTALEKGDIAYGNLSTKLAKWAKQIDKDEVLRRMIEQASAATVKIAASGIIPHWQMALDMKFKAKAQLEQILNNAKTVMHYEEGLNVSDPNIAKMLLERAESDQLLRSVGFERDVKMLRAAESYSFSPDVIHAIEIGAKSIPHETPLSAVEPPKGTAGWFWFSEPLNVTTASGTSDKTHALLWGWVQDKASGQAAIQFSAFVLDEKAKGIWDGVNKVVGTGGNWPNETPLPTTRWTWPIGMTFSDMLEFSRKLYRENYGDGSAVGRGGRLRNELFYMMGEDETVKSIADLSLFFLMSCVWFKQRVVIAAPAHVERHARKRYVKEHKLTEPPSVQVIALRKSLREPSEHVPESTDGDGRKYFQDYRIVVEGHNKLQRCGPGGMDRKLIWVAPYPKGPEDKPFRERRERVHAVIR